MCREEWTGGGIVVESRWKLGGKRCGSGCDREGDHRERVAGDGLAIQSRRASRPQHGCEFSALWCGQPVHHAIPRCGSNPPIFPDFRDSTKNIAPTAIIVIDSSIGSVRNPSAITGESASRNCSVE